MASVNLPLAVAQLLSASLPCRFKSQLLVYLIGNGRFPPPLISKMRHGLERKHG